MDLATYQQKVMAFAVYPRIGNNIDYPLVGWAEELGEWRGKLDELNEEHGISDHDSLSAFDVEALKLEAGDVLWYGTAFCQEIGLELKDLVLNDPAETFIPNERFAGDVKDSIAEAMEAFGRICGQVKRVHRDDGDQVLPERREKLKGAIQIFFQCFDTACGVCGFTVQDVMDANYEKLASRNARGVLHGSGDNR